MHKAYFNDGSKNQQILQTSWILWREIDVSNGTLSTARTYLWACQYNASTAALVISCVIPRYVRPSFAWSASQTLSRCPEVRRGGDPVRWAFRRGPEPSWTTALHSKRCNHLMEVRMVNHARLVMVNDG